MQDVDLAPAAKRLKEILIDTLVLNLANVPQAEIPVEPEFPPVNAGHLASPPRHI